MTFRGQLTNKRVFVESRKLVEPGSNFIPSKHGMLFHRRVDKILQQTDRTSDENYLRGGGEKHTQKAKNEENKIYSRKRVMPKKRSISDANNWRWVSNARADRGGGIRSGKLVEFISLSLADSHLDQPIYTQFFHTTLSRKWHG